jgi:hypothetical protein
VNQRQAIVLAMRIRPGFVRRRTWSNLTVAIYDPIRRMIWRVANPRMAWFAARVHWHYAYGFPMPAMPPHQIAA